MREGEGEREREGGREGGAFLSFGGSVGPKVTNRANTDRRGGGGGQVQPVVVVAAAVILTCASVRLTDCPSIRPSVVWVCGSAARLIASPTPLSPGKSPVQWGHFHRGRRDRPSVRRVRFRHFRNREARIKERRKEGRRERGKEESRRIRLSSLASHWPSERTAHSPGPIPPPSFGHFN